jgi:hypothetical protein
VIGIRYEKPLSLEDRLLIDTVTMRYGGVEAPFIAFDRGDHIELRCPPTIRRVTPYDSKSVIEAETPAVHGVPSNG